MKVSVVLIIFFIFSDFSFAEATKKIKLNTQSTRTVATDNDDCTLNFSDIKALIDSQSKQLAVYLGIAKDPVGKIQIESAVLTNGTHLIATTGGCAHIAQVFNYSTDEIKSDVEAVDLAIKYLEMTPSAKGEDGVKGIWLESLKQWKKKSKPSTSKVIDIGDGNDAILKLKYDVKNLLRIEYDFAL